MKDILLTVLAIFTGLFLAFCYSFRDVEKNYDPYLVVIGKSANESFEQVLIDTIMS
jgi:hypothetical protein